MKRRTLDIMFSIGGLGLAVLLVTLGVILAGEANFAKQYVGDQLAQENIKFTPADELTEAEKAYTNARSGCVIAYAGQTVTTGRQAECFANEYMLGHLQDPERANKGMSFAELGDIQADLRTKIAAAQANDDPELKALQDEMAAVTAARETVFRGSMLRNSLLTSYGFSILGEKAALGAQGAYIGAAVLALLAIAGFVHAFMTPKTKAFAPVEVPKAERVEEPAGV